MTPEEKAVHDALLIELKKMIDPAEKQSAEAIKAIAELKAQSAALETKSDPKEFSDTKAEVIRLAGELKALQEKGRFTPENLSLKGQIYKFISDNIEKIREIKAAGRGFIEFEVKAVADIYTTAATNPDGIPELVGVQLAAPTNVNLRTTIVDSLVSTFPTNQAAFAYTETLPKDGDFAFVAEGGLKPQIDFKIETRYAEPKKVAAYEVLSEEAVQDIPNMQSIAYNFLRKKHDLKRQNGILFGTGVGPIPLGATTYGRPFTAGGMAASVTNPNFMDVINAAITDIFTTHNFTDEMPYMANLVLVNPVDFYIELVAAKDAFGHPLYPQATLFNRVQIGNVLIIPFEDIPAGKIFVADMSKYNVTNYMPYTVKIGYINDQLIHNLFTIVGESRFHAFVKKLDEQAFIYDDIATIQAAITGV